MIGQVLAMIHQRDGVDLPAGAAWEKSSVWLLERDGDRFVTARYRPPPPPVDPRVS